MERLADAMKGLVLHAASARLVQLEHRVQQKLVRELVVGHAPRESGVRAANTTAAANTTRRCASHVSTAGASALSVVAILIEFRQRSIAGNLP